RVRTLSGADCHARLVAGAVFRPEYLVSVKRDLPAEEIPDDALASLYRALLRLHEDEGAATLQSLAGRVAEDAAASAALAGLPDDVPFDDWLPYVLREREQARFEERRRAALRALAVAGPADDAGAARVSPFPPPPPSLP